MCKRSLLIKLRGAVRVVIFVGTALAACQSAYGVPSFARQTGLACQSCHVGAFGPQLTQYGREFKLSGYTFNGGGDHVALAAMIESSFTHTSADQSAKPASGYKLNDNLAVDQISAFYGGRLFDNAGAFVQVTYDGVARQLAWDNLDLRFAESTNLDGSPLIFGATINNNPTVQDAWNSTPAWGFPFAASKLAPTPAAATIVDGGLSQQVLGAGAYALWNNLLYVELDIYSGLGRDVRNALGVSPVSGSNAADGLFPYWRVALQHDFGSNYLEIGTFGTIAGMYPGGDRSIGQSDRLSDVALDATYLYSGSPDYIVTGYVTYIHEDAALHSSRFLTGTNASDELNSFRANGSVSFRNTLTLSGQLFQTTGSTDPALYQGDGRPNSKGATVEVAFVPSGKPGSWFPTWLNARVSLQYTAYSEFNGSTIDASNNNTLFLLLWLAG